MGRNLFKLSLIVVVCSSVLLSCKNDDGIIIEPIEFAEIEDIVMSFQGDRESDIVIVNTQGGPVTETSDDFITEIINVTNTQNVLWVNVHQKQTTNPQLFKSDDITFEQAKSFDAESIANLERVITYFKKDLNKTVYVLGISFGAFMAQELINVHSIDVADKYLIMVGRLNIDEEIWMGFSNGKGGGYTYDTEGNATITVADQDDVEERNMSRLAAGLGHKRYMTLFNDISDLSKITYVFGDRDEQVGGLSNEEVLFLTNKGSNVLTLEGGNHSDTIDSGLLDLKTIFGLE
jgi:hypothetical protein